MRQITEPLKWPIKETMLNTYIIRSIKLNESEVKRRVYGGKYQKEDLSMVRYVTMLYYKVKHLDKLIEEGEFVRLIKNKFCGENQLVMCNVFVKGNDDWDLEDVLGQLQERHDRHCYYMIQFEKYSNRNSYNYNDRYADRDYYSYVDRNDWENKRERRKGKGLNFSG